MQTRPLRTKQRTKNSPYIETNSETTSLRANLMVSFFVQCNIFVNILYWTGPVQYTIYWTSLLTKTNSVNKNVKYNILIYPC